MSTKESVLDGIAEINMFREEHPLRTLTWGKQVLGLIGVQTEDGSHDYAIGASEASLKPHTALYERRINRILDEAGLTDVSFHIVGVHPSYLNPNWQK